MPQDPNDVTQFPAGPSANTRPSNTASGFIQAMVNIHEGRKNAAAGDLNRQLLAANAGFPVDPKALEKSAKRAGIPFMKPEDMKSLLNPPASAQPDAATDDQASGGGKQDPTAPNPYNVSQIKDVRERQRAENGFGIDQIVRQYVQNAQLRGETSQKILENTKQMQELKQQAMNGDSHAYGTLLKMGEIKPDITAEAWDTFTPDQRQKFLGTLYGAETDSQRAQRVDNSATELMASGAVTSPQAAFDVARTLAGGGTLSPEQMKEVRPVSMKDLVSEVEVGGKLLDMGLPPDSISSYARAGNLIGLSNLFPSGMKSLQQQQMAQKDKEIKIQQQRVGVEGMDAQTERMKVTGYTDPNTKKHVPGMLETASTRTEDNYDVQKTRAQNVAAKLDAQAKTKQQKDALTSFQALVDIKRAGGNVDPSLIRAAEDTIAKQFNVEPGEVETLWGWSSKFAYVPSGGGQAQPTQGGPTVQGPAGNGSDMGNFTGSPQTR